MRVVLEHSIGPWAGVSQILGTLDQIKLAMQVNELPSYIADVDFGDRKNSAVLVGPRRSYILYREIPPPTLNQESQQ